MNGSREPTGEEELIFLPISEIQECFEHSSLLVVTDDRLAGTFGHHFPGSSILVVPEGEKAKSWESLSGLLEGFVRLGVDRSWKILSLGGGSVSDLAGFAAHIWMRGISFSCAPTTLLSMIDASLGGKNGIDFQGYKNVLGSFQRPERIFCDVSTLASLDSAQFASGLAEAVKHAVIEGGSCFSSIESLLAEGGGPGSFTHKACSRESLERLVAGSQRVKLAIVAADPFEKGRRRVLNLGHSFGHAIELETGFAHGFAVSLGMALSLRYSLEKGFMAEDERMRILNLLSGFGLPVDLSLLTDRSLRARVASSLSMDKKREGDIMHFALPRGIGRVDIVKIPVVDLRNFLEEAFA